MSFSDSLVLFLNDYSHSNALALEIWYATVLAELDLI